MSERFPSCSEASCSEGVGSVLFVLPVKLLFLSHLSDLRCAWNALGFAIGAIIAVNSHDGDLSIAQVQPISLKTLQQSTT